MKIVTAGVCAAALLLPQVARADSFALNGAFTTEGVFTCLRSLACAGTGTNTVTLGSGSNKATLTFNGVDTTVAIGNVSTPVTLGQFQTSSGPGFTFPTRPNPNIAILRFDFRIQHSSPFESDRHTVLSFGPGGKSTLPFLMGTSYMSFEVPPEATSPGHNYSRFVYSFSPFPFSLSANGTRDFTAQVGVVPEPATMILVGGGLAAAMALRRRRMLAAR
jgi:hypothetical protein